MTVYQVLTGEWPFFPRREAEVTHAVISGERPPKPESAERIGMTGIVWNLLKECWREDRRTRPTISDVLGRFYYITGVRETTDSAIEGSGLRLYTGFSRDSIHSETTAIQCEWDDPPFERPYPTLL